MTTRMVRPARRLRGTVAVPGDKSISHRAAILNALATGDAEVQNFLPGADCMSTLAVLTALGVSSALDVDGSQPVLRISGARPDGLREPNRVLDCGNSGTTIRLMSGVLAGQPFHTVLAGDPSLCARPMGRAVTPLRQMGARIDGRDDGTLAPLAIRGGGLRGIHYRMPVASAQVKSALLLAGLFAEGETLVEEMAATRDHTERMLAAMGADITREGPVVRLTPGAALAPLSIRVPNDISAAAFWMVAASIHPDADIRLTGVGMNPTRSGVIEVLHEMGADLSVEEERQVGGEPVADIRVRSASLTGTVIEGDLVLRGIDELPVLAVAAAFATGTTEIRDAAELRVKESDRVAAIVAQLGRLGVPLEERDDGMTIEGSANISGGSANSCGDHRLAMALAVAGLASQDGVLVGDADATAISYPDFWTDLEGLSS